MFFDDDDTSSVGSAPADDTANAEGMTDAEETKTDESQPADTEETM